MKRKLTLIILGSIFISYFILIVLSSYNIRNLGIKGAKEKANIAAELVKSGLTSHMVNGMMSSREYFLDEIKNTPKIESLWLSRSDSLVAQFGEGLAHENKRDTTISEVLNSKKVVYKMIEESNGNLLRMSAPYIATKQGKINCMACHDAQENDVLGVVNIVIDVNDTIENGHLMTLIFLGISTLILIIVSLIIHRSMQPLMNLFLSIEDVMEKTQNGDYSKRVKNLERSTECKNVSFWINSLLNKLQITLQEIEKTANEFLTLKIDKNKDILIELKDVIKEISNVNKFKKTIENDNDKLQIYSRIGTILEDEFEITDFILVEKNLSDSGKLQVVYSTFEDKTYKVGPLCRAFKTKGEVTSDQFHKLCEECNKDNKHYFCTTYSISDDLELLLHINSDNQKIIEIMKKNLDKFKNYINEAKPELVSQNLTEILRVSSTTDTLTGLYNRKYLDEYIDKAIAQAKRSKASYAVLMVDIDFFKMVNDTYGHDVGDIAIKRLAKVLKDSIREADIAFRFGGEEFLVLLYNCEPYMVKEIAQKIRTTFEKEKISTDSGVSFSKTVSIGTAMFPSDSDAFWKVIKFADMALYMAKDTGRNKVVSFEKSALAKSDITPNF